MALCSQCGSRQSAASGRHSRGFWATIPDSCRTEGKRATCRDLCPWYPLRVSWQDRNIYVGRRKLIAHPIAALVCEISELPGECVIPAQGGRRVSGFAIVQEYSDRRAIRVRRAWQAHSGWALVPKVSCAMPGRLPCFSDWLGASYFHRPVL